MREMQESSCRTQPREEHGLDQSYRRDRIAHWDGIAREAVTSAGSAWYRRRLAEIYRSLVPSGARVLEVGCGTGDLLAAVCPSAGVGVDFSWTMTVNARRRYPSLQFVCADAHDLPLTGTFDVVILSDLVNDVWDVQRILEEVRRVCSSRTRVILNFYSRVWELPLAAATSFRLATRRLQQNWLTTEDVEGLLGLAGFEPLRRAYEILCPAPIPLVRSFLDRVVVKIFPARLFALTNIIVARPAPIPRPATPTVSIIIPARNERGNIEAIFRRTEGLGDRVELVFVEGHSTDDTYERIEEEIHNHPERRCVVLRQTGHGKGDAVRLGFQQAVGDVLIILDADLTVAPEDLPRFVQALQTGRAEFVNGVRLVYPMQDEAMRFANLLGNRFFSAAFSWLLGQPVKDTLCGTKALRRDDYEAIARNRQYFGEFDPFGDFDLLFGAAKLNMKIVDLPVRYHARTYGTTNIQRWRHGWLLLRMVVFAATRIKFI